MTNAPKDKPILAKFKQWQWWTLVSWQDGKWTVSGHNTGRYFNEGDMTEFVEVGSFNRVNQ